MKPANVSDELRKCCTKGLRKTLFDFVGSTTPGTLSEEGILEKIKVSAVIGKNKAVHRKEFYDIPQSPDELVNLFVAKLKAKSERCNFTIKYSVENRIPPIFPQVCVHGFSAMKYIFLLGRRIPPIYSQVCMHIF